MKRKIIFIGNSIVNGFPYSRGKSFPGLIRAEVKAGRADFHAEIINKGNNGETTAQILDRFSRDVLDHAPVCVFIMTGTNDFIYREETPAGCMANLQSMAQQAEAAGIIPVFLTPLFTDAAKASRMWMAGLGIDYDEINRQIGELADRIRSAGRLYLDLNTAYRTAAGTASGDSAAGTYIDGVHPTPEGYRFLADTTLQWMSEHLQKLGLL